MPRLPEQATDASQRVKMLPSYSTSKIVDFTGLITENVQTAFDSFYNVALDLLDQFYPEKSITVKSRD